MIGDDRVRVVPHSVTAIYTYIYIMSLDFDEEQTLASSKYTMILMKLVFHTLEKSNN